MKNTQRRVSRRTARDTPQIERNESVRRVNSSLERLEEAMGLMYVSLRVVGD